MDVSLVHIIVDELCLCLLLDSIKIVAFLRVVPPFIFIPSWMVLEEMRNLVLLFILSFFVSTYTTTTVLAFFFFSSVQIV